MNAGLEGSAASPGSDLAAARPPLRFVSAASLFDGHDAAINMIRRLLQARGAEVVHLGHNRSVADIVRDYAFIARTISVLEGAPGAEAQAEVVRRTLARSRHRSPVIGITGTGGAGKSSLTDELLARLVRQFPQAQIAVAAMDPTRRRSGGALLGDRIRIN